MHAHQANPLQYNTLKISLRPRTRSVIVKFDTPKDVMTIEMLFELETFFNWLSSRIEIHSVVFSSTGSLFSNGIDRDYLKTLSVSKLTQTIRRFKKLIWSMFYLPQTFIVDLKDGAHFEGAEFLLGCDFAFSSSKATISFSHLQEGMTPSLGAIELLDYFVGPRYSRSWILSGKDVSYHDLIKTGLVLGENTEQNISKELIAISHQAPVSRIQAKRALLENILPLHKQSQERIEQITLSSLASEDFRRPKEHGFMDAREFGKVLKFQRAKSEDQQNSPQPPLV